MVEDNKILKELLVLVKELNESFYKMSVEISVLQKKVKQYETENSITVSGLIDQARWIHQLEQRMQKIDGKKINHGKEDKK